MADVFISYSSMDKKKAVQIVEALEKHGISCWIASRNLPGGNPFPDEITTAIMESSIFVLLVSQNSQNSRHVQRELHLASNHGKIIIPYELDLCKKEYAFEYYLDNVQSIIDSDEGQKDLICVISNHLEQPLSTDHLANMILCPECDCENIIEQDNRLLERIVFYFASEDKLIHNMLFFVIALVFGLFFLGNGISLRPMQEISNLEFYLAKFLTILFGVLCYIMSLIILIFWNRRQDFMHILFRKGLKETILTLLEKDRHPPIPKRKSSLLTFRCKNCGYVFSTTTRHSISMKNVDSKRSYQITPSHNKKERK